jgi:segregation and condensation protein B
MNEAPDNPTAAAIIEGLLFVASEPVGVAELVRASGLSGEAVTEVLAALASSYRARGIRLQWLGEQVQLVSAPEVAPYAERFLGVQGETRLSTAALEVLAIVAYRQPITRAAIDAIRGVDSGGVLRALLARSLVAEAGRLDVVGRPIVYATTPEFLRQFGLSRLDELPALDLPATH